MESRNCCSLKLKLKVATRARYTKGTVSFRRITSTTFQGSSRQFLRGPGIQAGSVNRTPDRGSRGK
jgi:hypothetical protein